ncbi:16S rRNA (cytosine(967)-C(5))-methyltransferase [Clostridium sp. chh4-2]|uniref:16S rRNA (cytosine(967)-C(5))-methyltransferase RsmB n=1 Tax=Clostridium sp. chh4-2 TaxID=2067550 RepID=UPI000CCF3840|nr:16S rRNA (cytosine(967)-C(5))-methyltransferase RsmB [Clostridium sp. chh4-2]PNV59691.1 16S rRNA (cytosine(967)-C(5))-methyltransferase [Clostridium sp. chh4-2]
MTKSVNSREIALDVLYEILENKEYSHIVLRQALNKYQYLDKQERSFITRIVDGTLEYLIQIDYMINQLSKVKVKKMKPVIRTILRMSVYQIMYMDRVPDSAACDEAVKLAVKRKFQGLKGFVNGVLRNISRQKESFVWPSDSVRYSIPEWILEMWKERYDQETITAMAQSFLKPSKLAVRCNLDKASKEQITESLKEQKVQIETSAYSDIILFLSEYDYLEGLNAYTSGWIQVQDMSSSFVAQAAPLKPGDYVIDVCGAPGGKSLHVADRLKGTGMVDVRDLSEQKVGMIRENISRTGFTNIQAKVQDALEPDQDSVEKADVLFADLPCSGLGIMGKKPDIKINMTKEKAEDLAGLQREILSVVWQYVKPGGYLIYSTCTINSKENEENVRWFREHYPFEPVNIEGRLGDNLKEESMKEGFIQLLPGIHPCDGFFLSVFRRR